MQSLHEILLPTDFSPRSIDLARYAAATARRFHSRITLLHVVPGTSQAAPATDDAANRLNLFLSEELGGLPVERVVLEGDPADTIASYCAAKRVAMVMMPTRGGGSFRRYLLGSVAAKVLHDVACPVWTSSHVADGNAPASVEPKVIACAIDPTSEGSGVLRWAVGLAADLQARLVVAHSIPSLEFHPETYFLEADMRKALIGEAHAKISRMLRAAGMPDAEVRVEGGSVPALVRSAVEDSRADLLVIGRAPAGGMWGRLRTQSYALIRESPCPVVSV